MGHAEARVRAVTAAIQWSASQASKDNLGQSGRRIDEIFGADVFDYRVMRKRLPKETFKRLMRTAKYGKPLDLHVADVVAPAMDLPERFCRFSI